MKKILAITLFLFSILHSKAQHTISCDSLIKKQYKISELKDNRQFLEEVRTALLCKYDSLDMYIFMGPDGQLPLNIIATLGIKKIGTSNEDQISMTELMQTFSSMRKMPDYGELRTKAATLLQKKKMVDSDQVHTNLSVKKNKNEQVTSAGDKKQIVEGLHAFTDFTKGISKAKESGKPILVYFSAHNSIPARKFEDVVLRDPRIQEIINKRFEVVFLLVDDRTPLADGEIYYAKSLKRDVKYIGDTHLDLQLDQFESDRQPMFFIVNKAGKKVASSLATGVKEFFEFLANGS